MLWSQRFDRELEDVLELQDEIARTIVTALRETTFANIADPAATRHTSNVQAYGLYLRGRFAWNKRTQEGVAEGIAYFKEAIAKDPNYALAYTGLADSYALQLDYRNVPVHRGFEMAKKYARKALELDDGLAEAHASLAWSLFIYDWDWDAAEREFRLAIDRDPRYATAHQWYGFLLASKKRFEEALVEGHTAQETDPSSVSVRRSLGYIYLYARKYEQARYHLDRAIAMNPVAEENYRIQGLILTLEKKYGEAERVLREALELAAPDTTYTKTTLAYALAEGGDKSYALTLHEELKEKVEHDYVSPVELAIVNIALGEKEAAVTWLERAYEERRGWVAYLSVHPIADPLREEPRFQALAQKLGLPPR
jgi:serine/threonine-protein kinase